MAYIVRRVFAAKVGKAGPLVSHFKEGNKLVEQHGVKTRVLTDVDSGRSDRVVVEWEVQELGQMQAALSNVMADAAVQKEFSAWEAKMNEMIHFSEAETWAIR